MSTADDRASHESHLKRTTSAKAVIIEEPESISPLASPTLDCQHPSSLLLSPKKHRTSLGCRRLSGRLAPTGSTSSLRSAAGLENTLELASVASRSSRPGHSQHIDQVLSQVKDWLHHEKARASRRKSKLHVGHSKHGSATGLVKSLVEHTHGEAAAQRSGHHHRRGSSELSDEGFALEELEKILNNDLQLDDDNENASGDQRASLNTVRRGSTRRSLRKWSTAVCSDTDYQDGDILVPSAEVILDNSKTLSFCGAATSSLSDPTDSDKKARKETEAWNHFKNEIVRLAHTLKLKGWRRVPLDRGAEIDVERLSGALTNAVYVVSPPKDLSHLLPRAQDSTTSLSSKRPPAKLLLRIYGPQAEHLIDRDNELQILRRLARKKIGPRLLGTFSNGRFEQFFHAQTLTAEDLRCPETSKQIAKRMRELHEGIELLEEERNAGPFMWRNWDCWAERCEEIVPWMDEKMIAAKQGPTRAKAYLGEKQDLVCGVEWPLFREAVERYRKWLEEQYGGSQGIKDSLIFAHNDTQYGNLLRLQPSGESPLLHPANEHKQLVVIDFEYASANVAGQEFANHFTEWCYNYHDDAKSFALNERRYPTPEEQHRFVTAYVQHQPFQPSFSTGSSSATLRPGLTHSVSNFMLDNRAPPSQIAADEKRREEATESEVQRLIQEARIWRPANSAQWVAWGIVQAKVPGMNEALEARKFSRELQSNQANPGSGSSSPSIEQVAKGPGTKRPEDSESGEDEDMEGEFDYLSYARERAMFFWGDLLQMGLVKREELPEELRERVKIVKY